jgi:glutaredoxin-related protein
MRWEELRSEYNPTFGIGSPIPRFKIALSDYLEVMIPHEMAELPSIKYIMECGTLEASAVQLGIDAKEALDEFTRIRCKYDFEFWAASCVEIKTKEKGVQKFILNRPQRKLLKEMEQMRLAGIPIRIILLKSRQWGGSTVVQLYIAWIQLFHRTSWNAMVIAATKDQALHIRGMYQGMAAGHPTGIIENMERVTLSPYIGTQNIRKIDGRDNIIGVGSVAEPDSIRSFTTHMLHLSEVGSWASTAKVNAESLVATLEGGLVTAPYTLLVKESTAKGVGSYFH